MASHPILSSSSPRVRLQLHGYPRVWIDGRVRPLNLKRGLALLAYLADRPRAVGRSTLAALLWPDVEDGVGRGRLRRLVHEVHGVLGATVFEASADALWLAAGVHSDLADTRAAIGRAALADVAHLASPDAGELIAGFSLDSEAFDEWLAQARRALRTQLARALERALGAARAAARDDAAALEAIEAAAQALLCHDACAEAGHAARLDAAARRGDRAALEAAYFDAADAWRDEFGIRPSARIEAAYATARRLVEPEALAA